MTFGTTLLTRDALLGQQLARLGLGERCQRHISKNRCICRPVAQVELDAVGYRDHQVQRQVTISAVQH